MNERTATEIGRERKAVSARSPKTAGARQLIQKAGDARTSTLGTFCSAALQSAPRVMSFVTTTSTGSDRSRLPTTR
jgi:hypothetical protein